MKNKIFIFSLTFLNVLLVYFFVCSLLSVKGLGMVRNEESFAFNFLMIPLLTVSCIIVLLLKIFLDSKKIFEFKNFVQKSLFFIPFAMLGYTIFSFFITSLEVHQIKSGLVRDGVVKNAKIEDLSR